MGMQANGELAYGVWIEGETIEDIDAFMEKVEQEGSPLELVGLGDFSTEYVNWIVALKDSHISGDAWSPKEIGPTLLAAKAPPADVDVAKWWCQDHLPEVDFTEARWLLGACYA